MSSSSSALEVFRDCGIWSFLCLFIGAMGLLAGVVGVALALTKARGAAWIPGAIAVLAGLAAISGGLMGRQMGLARLEAAIASAADELTPDDKRRLREQGHKEANGCVPIGFVTGSGPLLLGGISVAVGLLLRKKTAV